MDNLFEQATRLRLTFPSVRGPITVEDLWDLHLTSKQGFSLDDVAKELARRLKDEGEQSFVTTTANPVRADLELKLEIVKHIIAVRIKEADERNQAAARKKERERLTEILHSKKDQELLALSPEEIQKRIDALGKD